MRPEAPCSHPGCDRPATEVAVVESAWEDSADGSALIFCANHADTYVRGARRIGDDAHDATLRARRGRPSR
jgi:hypothetical protein